MTANQWKAKIAAYLAWPPTRALAPDGAEKRGADLVEEALGERVDLPLEAARQAAGLDVPLGPDGKAAASMFMEDPKAVHPLSGEAQSLDLGDYDPGAVSAAVKEAVTDLRDDVSRTSEGTGHDPETLFLTLWRRLPETLRASGSLPEGAWDLMPADPRFPSLSTWHHASVASALAGAGESPALLLFTLGSPQSFVTTSRRTQDYWMGSFLISYLMWGGMKALADRCGPDAFLYPNLHGQPLVDRWLRSEGVRGVEPPQQEALQIANFPNVFTALVPKEEAEEIAEEVEQAIRKVWDTIGRDVKQEVERSARKALGLELAGTDVVWSEDWCRQLSDFPDRLGVFWAVCPWGEPGEVLQHAFPEEEESHSSVPDHVRALLEWVETQGGEPNEGMGYALLSDLASGALASRKALRDFPQVKEPGWKCSLCGKRRALRPEWDTAKKRCGHRREEVLLRLFWEDLGKIEGENVEGEDIEGENGDNGYQKLAGRIRTGDRLCAVCLTKRLALDAHFSDELDFDHLLFPSTATVATAPFKAALLEALDEDSDLADAIERYTRATYDFLDEAGAFYPSAAVPKLEALKEGVAREEAETLLRLDGEWLYEGAFDPDRLRREYEIDVGDQDKLDKLRLDALESLRALLEKSQGLGSPSRYYAILSMDGDKMGDRIQGKNAPFYEWMLHPDALDDLSVPTETAKGNRLKRPIGPGTHLALSGALKDFALRLARFAVEKAHRGKLIFAGGDDAIALVPVADLLSTMQLLRTFFQGRDMAGPEIAAGETVQTEGGFGQISNNDTVENDTAEHVLLGGPPHERELHAGRARDQGPTASIGVAIVHESAPLVPSIEEAEKAMKESAKEKAGRDAFAVHLLKRSGAPLHMAAPFFPGAPGGNENRDVLAHVARLADYLREERFTARLGRDMLDRPLDRENEDLPEWLREARRAELHRLTRRRTREAGDGAPIETLDALLRALHVAEEEALKDDSREHVASAWRTLAHLIRLADFLASRTAHAD